MKGVLSRRPGFTLVELLVSMAILVLLLLVLVSMTDATRKTWSYTNSRIEQFRNAREAFESITRKLSQATLNTYWDYHYPNNDTTQPPDSYIRQSELRFISGDAATLTGSSNTQTHAVFFQAPMGYVSDTADYSNLENLLNTWGYFIEFGSDSSMRPAFINSIPNVSAEHYRFRLMELMEPSDSLTLYNEEAAAGGNSLYKLKTWFTIPFSKGGATRPVRPLAENIVALVLLPKLTSGDQTAGNYTDASLAPNYLYDSTGTGMNTLSDKNLDPVNQLPPIVQVTMVAVDETTFNRLVPAVPSGHPAPAMPDLGLSKLFNQASDYQKDLDQLQANLLQGSFTDNGQTYTPSVTVASKLNYRLFTTNVSLKAAKWSRQQTN